jgi:catechol 2,3-dioxygenase-like lactoylglutathione lyase family enzyme
MKRFHISIAVPDYAAAVTDYSKRLGASPCVSLEGRYALWRTDLLNFSISCKVGQPAGVVRHIGFEDDAIQGFREETDSAGIVWEYFTKETQMEEIHEKFPKAKFSNTTVTGA